MFLRLLVEYTKCVKFAKFLTISTFSLLGTVSHGAIDIIFDYSYDTGNYFGDEQRYVMEQVAYAFESRMGGASFTCSRPLQTMVGLLLLIRSFTITNPTNTGGGAPVELQDHDSVKEM